MSGITTEQAEAQLTVMIGRRFERLTVVSPAGQDDHGFLWQCQCVCGNIKVVRQGNLRSGNTKSCGCLVTRHHDSFSREYCSWVAMIQRCTNPKNASYHKYGAKNITVCQRWLTSYPNFVADMGRRSTPEHSMDRIDNTKGYSPDNCRWATMTEQNNNKRTNLLITYNSTTRPLKEWASLIGVNRDTLYTRLYQLGWPVGRALGFDR